jgi:hypothetical protein
MSGRKEPAGNTSVCANLLRMLLNSLEEELPRALELRERLHMIPEPSHEEHATCGLVAEALGTGSVEAVAFAAAASSLDQVPLGPNGGEVML